MKRKAFTLSEILIALIVIGVVAALTIPNLIYSHKKRIIETSLIKFSSMWQQAIKMSEAEHGENSTWETLEIENSDAMLDFYNKYFDQYIKTVEYAQTPKGVAFRLPNGNGFHIRKNAQQMHWYGNFYITFCIHYDKCKNLDDSLFPHQMLDGKEKFHFDEFGIPITTNATDYTKYTREELLENCKTVHYLCTGLIQHDGWKIKDDYPVKL